MFYSGQWYEKLTGAAITNDTMVTTGSLPVEQKGGESLHKGQEDPRYEVVSSLILSLPGEKGQGPPQPA